MVGAALPAIRRRGRVIGRTVVGVEGVPHPRVNNDLDVFVPGRFHHLAELDRFLGLGALVLTRPVRLSKSIWSWFLGSVIKKRRKKMRKHKHKKMLKKTRWQRRAHA